MQHFYLNLSGNKVKAKLRFIAVLCFMVGCLGVGRGFATTITSTASGSWATTTTWVGGVVPSSSDDVIIASGHTVTIGTTAADCNNITITGTLDCVGTLNVYGDFTRPGTFNRNSGTVSFNGSSAQSIICTTGSIYFYNLTISNTSSSGVKWNNGYTLYVTNNFTITNNCTFTWSAGNINQYVSSSTPLLIINGIFDIQSGAGTFTAGGTTHVYPSGTIKFGNASSKAYPSYIGSANDATKTTYDAGSTFEFYSTISSSADSYFSLMNGEDFSNFYFHSSLQSYTFYIFYYSTTTIAGTLTINSPSVSNYTAITSGSKTSANVGNLIVNNGLVWISDATSTRTVNVNGNTTINGGTFKNYTSSASAGVLNTNDLTLNGGIYDATYISTNLTGNWTNNGGTFTNGSGTVALNGTSAQTIGGSAQTTFYNLTINNSSGVSLNKAINVGGNLTFSNGILTTDATNILSVTNNSNAAVVSPSNSKYVNGPMKWTLSSGTAYSFPVGKGGTYYPFGLTPTGTAPVIQVEAFNSNCGGSADGISLSSISTSEYWCASVSLGTFTSGNVSITRQTALGLLDNVGRCTTANGTYSSLNGTINSTSIINSDATGSGLGYFVMSEKYCPASNSFYSKSSGNLNDLATWGTNTDGSGARPCSFTSANKTFYIVNNSIPTIGAAWTVSGTGSKIVIGNGTNACNFTIPPSYALSTPAIDVSNNATLTIQNTTIPTFGILNAGSTINYNANAAQTIASATYGNLILSRNSGTTTYTKTAGGTLTVAGVLTIDDVYTIFAGGTYSHSIGGSWTNNGSYTCGSGTVTLTGVSKSIGGSASATFFNNLTISTGASYIINPTVSDRIKVAGTFTQNTGSTLTIEAGKFIDLYGGLIILNGNITSLSPLNGVQDIDINNSANLSGSGAINADMRIYGGTTTLGSDFNLDGNFIILSGAAFTMTTHNFHVAGNWTNNGTLNFGTGTVNFDGTTSQDVDQNGNDFYNLTINTTNSSDNVNLVYGNRYDIKNNLLINKGVLSTGSATYAVILDVVNNTTINIDGTLHIGYDHHFGTCNNTASNHSPTGVEVHMKDEACVPAITPFLHGEFICHGKVTTDRPIISGFNDLCLFVNHITADGDNDEIHADVQIYAPATNPTVQNSDVWISGDLIVQNANGWECSTNKILTIGGNLYIYDKFVHNGTVNLYGNMQDQPTVGTWYADYVEIDNSTFNFYNSKFINFSPIYTSGKGFGNVNIKSGTRKFDFCLNTPTQDRNVARITKNITIDAGTTLDMMGNDLYVGGDWTNNGTYTPNNTSQTTTFNGNSTIDTKGTGAGKLFYNVNINGASASLANNPLNIDGSLNIYKGSLNAGSQNITVAGNWSSNNTNSGTFNGGSANVTFDETSNNVTLSRTKNGGKIDNTGTGSYTDAVTVYQIFSSTKAFKLVSVKVYGQNFGNVTVYLKNFVGTTLASTTCAVPDGESRILLNFDIPIGTNLRIGASNISSTYGNFLLFRDAPASNLPYPYSLGNVASITGAYNSSAVVQDRWYYFYDWEYSDKTDFTLAETFNNVVIDKSSKKVTQHASFSCKDLTITAGELDANNDNITLTGDWNNNATFTHSGSTSDGNGYVKFSGSSSTQHIKGSSATTFYNLDINNSSTGVYVDKAATARRKLGLLNGILFSTNTTDCIILTDTAFVATNAGYNGDATAGKSTSFVDGPIRKIGRNRINPSGNSWNGIYTNTYTFCFPTGDDNKWAPVTLSQFTGTTATTDAFTGEYHKSGHGSYNVLSPLDHVSEKEWWNIAKESGNADLHKKIYLYAKSLTFSLINNIADPDLVVAHFNGSAWEACERTTNGSDFVESDSWGTFSPFTFASKSKSNLPVELLTFNAKLRDTIVDLFWSTASEMNSDYFTVERSADGINFNPVLSHPAAGISNSIKNYFDIDNNPLTGLSYYRLKETDFDGSFQYSEIISVYYNPVSIYSQSQEINIFPNPSTDNINIVFNSGNDETVYLRIFDIVGKLVYSKKLSVPSNTSITEQLDVKNFQNGIYFLQLISTNNKSQSKFIKTE